MSKKIKEYYVWSLFSSSIPSSWLEQGFSKSVNKHLKHFILSLLLAGSSVAIDLIMSLDRTVSARLAYSRQPYLMIFSSLIHGWEQVICDIADKDNLVTVQHMTYSRITVKTTTNGAARDESNAVRAASRAASAAREQWGQQVGQPGRKWGSKWWNQGKKQGCQSSVAGARSDCVCHATRVILWCDKCSVLAGWPRELKWRWFETQWWLM